MLSSLRAFPPILAVALVVCIGESYVTSSIVSFEKAWDERNSSTEFLLA
jgi:hypothetical protein